jgi:hypothetical protein
LTGTADAGSNIEVFDGGSQIGTATADASGAWSVATDQLSSGTHDFTAKAADAAGNISSASSPLSVNVDAGPLPPVTSPPVTSAPASDANLLVNGSFEASPLAPLADSGGSWGAFSSIPGWTALTGGTIELWNNLNDVQATDGGNFAELGAPDGFYQDVKTTAGQNYDLSFDARSPPGLDGSTGSIEILWNDSVVGTVPPGNTWNTYTFPVTGTGGQDRLIFREVAGQGADGLGALYDNVSLVAAPGSNSAAPLSSGQPSSVSQTDQAMGLVSQYSAASFANSGPGLGSVQPHADTSAQLSHTLAKSLA